MLSVVVRLTVLYNKILGPVLVMVFQDFPNFRSRSRLAKKGKNISVQNRITTQYHLICTLS